MKIPISPRKEPNRLANGLYQQDIYCRLFNDKLSPKNSLFSTIHSEVIAL